MTDEQRKQIEDIIQENKARSASLIELIKQTNEERERIDEDYHREEEEGPDSPAAASLWDQHLECVDLVSKYTLELNEAWDKIINGEIDLYEKDYDLIMADLKEGVKNYTKADFRADISIFRGDGTVKRNYEFFFSYLVSTVALQLSALQRDHLPLDEAFRIIDAKASDPKTGYRKPQKIPKDLYIEFQDEAAGEGFLPPAFLENPEAAAAVIEASDRPFPNCCFIPSTQFGALLRAGVSAGDQIGRYPDLVRRYNHRVECSVIQKRRAGSTNIVLSREMKATKTSPGYIMEISCPLFLDHPQGDTELHKTLTRITDAISKQAFINGAIVRDHVSIPLEEFVKDGQFASVDSARNSINSMKWDLLHISMSNTETDQKGNVQRMKARNLLNGIDIDNSVMEIDINKKFQWADMMAKRAQVPALYYGSPHNASELIMELFVQARISADEVAKTGQVVLSMRRVQAILFLKDPDEGPIANPKREKDRVQKAVDAINKQFELYAPRTPTGPEDKALLPDAHVYIDADPKARLKNWLDTGRLVMTLKGEYLAIYQEISEKRSSRIKAATTRKKRKKSSSNK